MRMLQPLDRLGRFKKFVLWGAGIITAYTVLGFLIIPFTMKLVAIKKLSETLHRPVSIESVKLNPYALSLTINKLNIQEPKEPSDFLSFTMLYVNLSGASVFKLAPVVEECKLDGFHVRVVRIKDTFFNFSDIITPAQPGTKPAQPPAAAAPLLKFSLNNIQITNGRAEIQDQVTGKTHTIQNLNLAIPFVSNIGTDVQIFVQPHFATIFNKTPIELNGQTKPFADSLETTLSFSLKGIDLAYYFAYVPVRTNLKLTSGSLDIAANVTFTRFKDKPPESHVTGDVAVKDLSITDIANNPVLKFGLLQTKIAPSSFLTGKVHLAKVLLQGPEIGITRGKDGNVNIYNLVPAEEQASPAPPAATAKQNPFTLQVDDFSLKDARVFITDFFKASGGAASAPTELVKLPALSINGVSVDTAKQEAVVENISAEQCAVAVKRAAAGDLNVQAIAPPPAANTGPPWTATVNKLTLKKFAFKGEHLTAVEDSNVFIDEITLDARDFSTKPGTKGNLDFSCRVNNAGTISVKGACGIAPVAAELKLDVKEINLAGFQPFLAGFMNARLAGGSFSTSGSLNLAQDKNKLATKFAGSSAIANFALTEKDKAADLLKWKQLKVSGIDAGTAPLSISIKAITLEKLFSKIIINPDKTINLALVIKSELAAAAQTTQPAAVQQPPPPAAKPAEPLPLAIGLITLKGGKIIFNDRSVSPVHTSSLTDINGTIRDIAPKQGKKAAVALNTRINNSAPLKVTGTLDPFKDGLSLDLKVLLQDMDLSPFTPYSGKYAGYTIQKGKLSLELHYTIEDKKLVSTNDVFIDQFDFGETVKSPDAINLPVKLGVSLLKDSSGKIKLNLPVTGRLDDPQFSIFGIILKVLKNILIKAATSPFSLLGSMVGSKEDLSCVIFDPGSARLSDAEKSKLNALAKALADRPNLSMEISGFVDTDADRQGLVDAEFRKQLLAKKPQKKAAKEETAAAEEPAEIAPEEFEKLLKKAYSSAKFEKPKNAIGFSKGLPAAEMEALIKKNITITDEDLHALAKERAEAVKDFLAGPGKVAAGRLFMVKPPGLAPEKKENVKNSRVDLKLK